jgi:YNFM family putative membrane transporter
MRETIFLYSLASVISGIALRVVEPMLPRLATDFGVSVSIASTVITAYAVTYAGSQFAYGPLGDRYGKSRVVTFTLICAALSAFGCAFAWHVASLAAMRFIAGLFASSAFLLGLAYIGDRVPIAERQPVVARFVIGTITGQALGPVIGGVVTDWIGWQGTFALVGAIFAAVALVFLVRTRSDWAQEATASPIGNPFTLYLQVSRISRVRYVMVISFLETFFFWSAFSFLGAFLSQRFGMRLALIGAILSGYGAGGVIYTLVVRRLLMALGQRVMASLGGALCFGCYATIVLTPAWPVVVPCVILVGFAFYMVHNTIQTKATEMAPHARGTGLSLFSITWTLGQAVGVAVMGYSISLFGMAPSILAFGAGFLALALWLTANLHRL